MKDKKILTTAIVFLLVLNTSYFWEGKFGLLMFLVYMALFVVYLVLLFSFFRYFYFAIREKFQVKHRLVVLGILTFTVFLTFFKPDGIVDFDKLAGNDLLVATREGGGNCTTTLKLKETLKFSQTDVCFGINQIKGTYHLKGDTIFFDNQNYLKYGVIKRSLIFDGSNSFYLFRDTKDTVGVELEIIKNDLHKLRK